MRFNLTHVILRFQQSLELIDYTQCTLKLRFSFRRTLNPYQQHTKIKIGILMYS